MTSFRRTRPGAVAGLLPSHGAHADAATTDSWSRGPWLSIIAHVPVVADVAVLTWALVAGIR